MDLKKLDSLDLILKEEVDPRTLSILGKIGDALALMYARMAKPLILPKIFQVKGQVEVIKQPSVKIENLREMEKYFTSLEKTFNNLMLAIQSMPRPEIKLPKIEIPAQVKNDNPELMELIKNLNQKIDTLSSQDNSSIVSAVGKVTDAVNHLYNKRTMVPQPVTNININPLQGLIRTFDDTVGIVARNIPNYGQLPNRRALQIYNNSANTIYIGGADVTTGNGMPVLAESYSQIIDAGYNMIVYGIAATNNNDIRVMEVAATSVGTTAIQE